ncbi:MAG: hypothetical protein AAF985_23625 [Bacteroidota bacterium]
MEKRTPDAGGKNTMFTILDLKKPHLIEGIFLFDQNSQGWLRVEYGAPGQWTTLFRYHTYKYKEWKSWLNLDIQSRYLRIVCEDPQAIIGEILLCGQSLK